MHVYSSFARLLITYMNVKSEKEAEEWDIKKNLQQHVTNQKYDGEVDMKII